MADDTFGQFLDSGDTAPAPRESFGSFLGGQDQAAPAPPKLAHEVLPHPNVVDQATTAIARTTVEAATRPTPQHNPLADFFRGFVDPSVPGGLAQMLTQPIDAGAQKVRQGAHQVASEPGLKAKAEGVHQVVSGSLEGISPTVIPAALANPIATAVSLGAGMGSRKATKAILKRAGVPDEYADLASDVVGIVAASGAAKGGHKLYKATRDATLREVQKLVGPSPKTESFTDFVKQEKSDVTQPAVSPSPAEAQPQSRGAARPEPNIRTEPGQQSRPAVQPPRAAAVDQPPQEGPQQVLGPNREYFRGDWNIPLNEKGKQQVSAAAERNSGQFDEIYAGTKDRHQATARAYAATNPQATVTPPSPALDPMHLGMHEGEEVTPERLADINDRLVNRPNEPIPGTGKFSGSPGERPAQWKDRLIDKVDELRRNWKPGQKILAVTSGRDVQAVRAWVAKGMPADKSVDLDVLTQRWETQPGEMMRLDPRTGQVENVNTADKEGIYFARHGETDGNDNPAVPADVQRLTAAPGVVKSPEVPAPAAAPAEKSAQTSVQTSPPNLQPTAATSAPEQPQIPPAPQPIAKDDGVYLGAGLGALEPLFREAKEEGDRLRLQRNQALEAAKNAEATPAEKKSGEAVRAYFTSERDLWGARANQALDIIGRKVLPKIQNREAVAIAREFRHKPQELAQFIDGSHPFLTEENGRTAHLEKLQPVMREAMRMIGNGMTERETAADKVFTKLASESLAEGMRGGWLGSRWQSDEYVPHILNPKGEGEVAQLPSTRGRQMGKIGKFFGFGERRAEQYPTLVHAVADGIIPKTLDPVAAFTIHADQFARARATHLLMAHLAETGLGKWGEGDRMPEGWVPLAPHTEEFARHVPYLREAAPGEAPVVQPGKAYKPREVLQTLVGDQMQIVADDAKQRLYVPEFLAKALSPITAPDFLGEEVPGFAKFRSIQRGLKQAILGLSGFHLLTENLMAKASMGPTAMWKALRIPLEDPATLANERDLIAHGGTTSIEGQTMGAYRNLRPGTIPTRGEVLRAYIPGSKQALEAADAITRLTFENIQRRYKIWDFAFHRDAWIRDNPDHTPEQLRGAKQGIASYVNGVYGGLHWENMGINRAALEVGRAAFLAPDWSGSNIALGKYAFDARPSLSELGGHRLAGAVTKEAVQARLSRAFWTKQVVQGVVENQMLSLMFSGKFSPRPFQVYMGDDKDGRQVYQNVVFRGSMGDAISLGTKLAEYGPQGLGIFAGSKAAPGAKLIIHQITGRNDFGKQIADPRLDFAPKVIRWMGTTLMDVSPTPIVIRSAARSIAGDESDSYLWSERFMTLFGQPAQHVPPPGMMMTREGLVEKPEREARPFWEQVTTGKP